MKNKLKLFTGIFCMLVSFLLCSCGQSSAKDKDFSELTTPGSIILAACLHDRPRANPSILPGIRSFEYHLILFRVSHKRTRRPIMNQIQTRYP